MAAALYDWQKPAEMVARRPQGDRIATLKARRKCQRTPVRPTIKTRDSLAQPVAAIRKVGRAQNPAASASVNVKDQHVIEIGRSPGEGARNGGTVVVQSETSLADGATKAGIAISGINRSIHRG